MEITFDSLSFTILAAIVAFGVVHLVFLRKPEPETHPLLLGRQSELSKVRKANESPPFVSTSAGLGGLAKSHLRDCKSVLQAVLGKNARLSMGTVCRDEGLDGKVEAMRTFLGKGGKSTPLTVKLDDPADALVTLLAARLLSDPSDEPSLVVSAADAFNTHAKSPLAMASSDASLLKDSPIGASSGDLFLVNSGPQAIAAMAAKLLPQSWSTRSVNTEDISQRPSWSGELDAGGSADFVKMVVYPNGQKTIATLSQSNVLSGGIVSVLSMFPSHEKLNAEDRILSYESASHPYGLAVALAGASTGATLRLCSATRGIVSKCRTYRPSVIFCSPNELNAIKTVLSNALPPGGAIIPLAKAMKRSVLHAGSVQKHSFWDNLIFAKIRAAVVGPNLRCIVCSAEEGAAPSYEVLEFLRIVLGIPVIVALTHPLVVGPISHTMFYDFQEFRGQGELSHVGCPAATMELKLVNGNESDLEQGNYRGEIAVKGPAVIKHIVRSDVKQDHPQANGWTRTGLWAELRTNGTTRIIRSLS